MGKKSSFKINKISFFAIPILILSLLLLVGKSALDNYAEQKMADGYRLAVQHSVERRSDFAHLQAQMRYSRLLARANKRHEQIDSDINQYITAVTAVKGSTHKKRSAEEFLAN